MIKGIKSLFAWQTIAEHGVYAYQENGVTGARRAIRVIFGGYSPLAQGWLDGGSFDDMPPPPKGGSGVCR